MTITGTVVDAAGKPVRGARVYIVKAPGAIADVAALSGADGRFSLAAGAAGSYEIECLSDTLGRALARVEVGARGATIELRLGKS